jgi:hypothetical protein
MPRSRSSAAAICRSRHWSARFTYQVRNEVRIEDYVCGEPHRDISHIQGVRRP